MRPWEGWNLGRERALLATRALRAAIVPACAATAVAVWAVGSRAALGRALVIAAEKALEASVVIGALRRRLRERPAAGR